MSVVILKKSASAEDIQKAQEEYKSYIKVTVDIEKGFVAIGGEFHADSEEKLLELGATQENIWGGGINLETGEIETNAIINIRSKQNNLSADVLDSEIREKFIKTVEKYLNEYTKK
ncbi:hypothetical protein COT69_01195 [candidate division WWE3 bacterium CG09_land_8_20_14_0_10_39_24]|uniref:Uncharacterized protein n=2 Tax=Katanobacteria TaxID=422282 RepID=A0A2G9XBB4_UNCKA|nr:MAG: hypothetical protein AUJ94_01710 [bacterium CG2_30_40_12]OJI09140.1 MAG: hypothetical protein BK003_01175 [bacterium CG09_39_24]PIP04280.1 MAG: hypothetical protein COX53_03330 [candidate division WWE3 bacterium CG23_combo_of_CG06-09_8_20_14_all_40_14]PIS12976.1 MAG: hypothetical protein COT69_01195 [candidate division WWE3 bacterium CG09_land_8_20_14_0_10_39_24]PJE52248.1 MAG: hypothetical protein COV27_00105 [candidate division WWE3 bacterium CG10_big_fil_rev_8_21_14_0_10_39_14]